MPNFYHDAQGNLQPAAIHEIDMAELHRHFVEAFPSSTTREVIFEGLRQYISDFSSDVGPRFQQWINGSFVSKKDNPRDIDVVNFVPAESCTTAVDRFLTDFGSRDHWKVDGLYVKVYPEDHPYHELTRRDMNFYKKFFMTDREGHKKGILSIEHGNGTD